MMGGEGCVCPDSASVKSIDFLAGKAQKHVFSGLLKNRVRNASKNNCIFFPCLLYGLG